LSLDRRRIIHFNVTTNPTAGWTSLQLIQTLAPSQAGLSSAVCITGTIAKLFSLQSLDRWDPADQSAP